MQTLRPFQLDLIDKIREAWRAGHNRIVVQAPTGAGKNTVAAAIVRAAALKAKRVLCMVHRRKLVDQISQRLHEWEVQHAILMRGERVQPDYHVQVASRDTLVSRCVDRQWIGLPPADLVVLDEAHHAALPSSEYRHVLAQYPSATVLLLTATPVGPDGQGLGPWAQAIVCSAGPAELICQGYLVPVRVYAPERRSRGKKGLAGDLVSCWRTFAEDRPTVLFCNRVKHSRDAVQAYAESGIPAAHVDANTPDEERDRIFADLATGNIKVVCNVGIIGEGVDIPELGCCQMFCEVGSRTKLLQCVGRIMRPFPGKVYGILIDHAGAVFRHGFPDEDMEWTLLGNADEAFAAKHRAKKTEAALYCKHCALVFHGGDRCPQCGHKPAKAKPSIWAPPPRVRDEFLTEAERNGSVPEETREQKVQHWWRCLNRARKCNGTFTMASSIYRRKYNEWPPNDFPCLPGWDQRRRKISQVYPDFGRRQA